MRARLGMLLLAVVLAGALAVSDRRPASTFAPGFGTARPFLQAQVPPPTAIGSTWFCPGVPSSSAEPGAVILLNPSAEPITTTVTLFPAGAASIVAAADLKAGARLDVDLAKITGASTVGVMVESKSARLVVEQRAATAAGLAATPCVGASSDQWYSADGTTTKDASYQLVLMNPFPTDAVVDLTLLSEAGTASVRGIYVPARSLKVQDLGESGTRRKQNVALHLASVSGRVIAGRVLRFDGTGDRAGLVAGPLAPVLGTNWQFADGRVADGVAERYVAYNPGPATAELQVSVFTDVGPALAPIAVSVAPGATQTVDMVGHQVPTGAHRVIVESTNEVPVVVERVVDTSAASGTAGITSVFGSLVGSNRWWFADGSTAAGRHETIVIGNLTGTDAIVTVNLLTPGGPVPLASATHVTVKATASVSVDVSGEVAGAAEAPLAIEATSPVVVERRITTDGQVGVAGSLGLPR